MPKVNEIDQVKAEQNLGVPRVETGNIKLNAAPSFTPGPWEVGDSGEGLWWVTGPDKSANVICDVVPRGNANEPDHEDYANARLIAAAPELYEATLTALAYVETLISPSWTQETLNKMMVVRQQLRAALAKVNAPERETETQQG